MTKKASRPGLQTSLIYLVLAVLMGLPFLAGGQTNPSDSNLEEEVQILDVITVTARRREEDLQSVPGSVSVVRGNELIEKSLSDLREAAAFVPNLSMTEAGTNANGAAVFIRGVGQSAPRINLDSGVGIYVDGIYRSSIDGGFLDLPNIDRIEVLRGPQGTLYGRNTIGGAVKVETIKPDHDESNGTLEIALGERDRFDFNGTFNQPLKTGKSALRLSFGARNADGYVEQADGDSAGDQQSTTFLAQYKWQMSDRTDILLSADRATSENNGLAKYHVSSTPTELGQFYNSLVAQGLIQGPFYTADQLVLDDPSRNNDGSPYARLDFEEWGVSGVVTFDNDDYKVTSYTAYRQTEQVDGFDLDGTTIELLANDRSREFSQFSQELQYNGSLFDGFIDLVAGLYYLETDSEQQATQVTLPELVPFGIDLSVGNTSLQDLTSISVYSEAKINLSDSFGVSVGVRYVDEEKDVTGGGILEALSPNPIVIEQSSSENYSNVSPRFVLEYKPSDAVLFYTSATKGFKSGGINDTIEFGVGAQAELLPFDEEELWAYEAGIKSQLFDNRLRLNLTAFYSDYENLQLRLLQESDFGIVRQFLNAGAAELQGAELEAVLAITSRLAIQISGALLDSEYAENVIDASGQIVAAAGESLEFAPESSYTLGFKYSRPIGSDGDLELRADYAWQDEQFFGLAGGQERSGSDAYGLFNLSVAWATDDFTVRLYGKNVTDEEYVTNSLSSTTVGTTFLFAGRPRELGVRVRYRF